jgi:hypothetical protein
MREMEQFFLMSLLRKVQLGEEVVEQRRMRALHYFRRNKTQRTCSCSQSAKL